MSAIYEALKDLLLHEKGTALATVVRGPEHIGAKMLVHADKSTRGTLGIDALNTLVVADAERAIWNGEAGTRCVYRGFSTAANLDYRRCWSYCHSPDHICQNAQLPGGSG